MEHLTQEMINGIVESYAVKVDENKYLTEMEMDALGESVNISMGAAAKVLSTILNVKVSISTPKVSIVSTESFEYKSLVPAVGVKIKYVEGLTGANFFVIKQQDVKSIVNIMMGRSDEEDEPFNDLHISAISEVMNQMMGASSTSLATFFNRKINISIPECIVMQENDDAKHALDMTGEIVVIKLKLKIGEIIDSELINVMPVEFAQELADNLINVQLPLQTETTDESIQEKQNVHEKKADDRALQQPSNSNQTQAYRSAKEGVKTVQQGDNYSPVSFTNFGTSNHENGPSISNLNIIMDVPLEVIVQIGKARKQVKEIIEFTQGSIIELDKQAGDPVDIIVNGELIAKGDVVVIDDNFGVRITEIIQNKK